MQSFEQDALPSDEPEQSPLASVHNTWRTASQKQSPELDLYGREEWKLACRIATSKGMAKSELLPRFLLHICEMSLRGRKEEITEQRIGMLIFNRPMGYNPGEDNIVRSYARTLRKRLEDYFSQEGREEPLRMTIPRGGYVPVFEQALPGEGRNEDSPRSPPVLPQSMAMPNLATMPMEVSPGAGIDAGAAQIVFDRRVVLAAILGLVGGAVLATAVWFASAMAHRGGEQGTAHRLCSDSSFTASPEGLQMSDAIPKLTQPGIVEVGVMAAAEATGQVSPVPGGTYLGGIAGGTIVGPVSHGAWRS
jgi:hypothetical protein